MTRDGEVVHAARARALRLPALAGARIGRRRLSQLPRLMWVLQQRRRAHRPHIPSAARRGEDRGSRLRADFILDAAMVSRVHCRLRSRRRSSSRSRIWRARTAPTSTAGRVHHAMLNPGDAAGRRVDLAVRRESGNHQPTRSSQEGWLRRFRPMSWSPWPGSAIALVCEAGRGPSRIALSSVVLIAAGQSVRRIDAANSVLRR